MEAGLTDRVDELFAPKGVLAHALPEFEARSGQRRMAEAAARVFEAGGVLLAEAGTGTGKTLAYLVPALLSRQRVLISTGTKNLQEQIYFKDLPILERALDVPFRATYMKGRGNYLCLQRFEAKQAERDLLPGVDQLHLERLARWLSETDTGDRAELADLPEDWGGWSDVAASSDTCLGTECPRHQDCFVTKMRQRAAESDLVIVNHHLLCADAAVRQSAYGEVIPDCHFAVIDEAHQLEDVATQYFGIAVSGFRVDDLVRDAERLVARGMPPDPEARADVLGAALRARDRARPFFALLADLGPGAAASETRARVTPLDLDPVREAGQAVAGALTHLESTIALLKETTEDLISIARRASALRGDLEFLLRATDTEYVYYLERRARAVSLRASPIDVSTIVRDLLLDRMQGTILTSATLCIEGSFRYLRERLGIRQAEELQLPSEFDYTQQALLYLPPRMPDPRAGEFAPAAAEVVIEILRRTRGRAFVLFTSYATLRAVLAIAETRLEFPLLVQGTAPRSALLARFRSTPHAVLLATSSFWQGVDVSGEALSCVIIDKLPFASPGDPVTAARIEALVARGERAFDEYQVPLAILTLRQGLGRLLRHRTDRGVLALLDPRVRTKGYGRRFLAALPPAPITTNLSDLGRFFGAEDATDGG